MNSRFKFRVWNPDGKYYDDDPQYNVCVQIDPISGLVLAPFHNNIIEQCTGLKDKNGKLIYEGDIVADGCVKRTVVWGGWYWNAKAKANCPLDNITCSIVEVIGNIHEQAEQKDK